MSETRSMTTRIARPAGGTTAAPTRRLGLALLVLGHRVADGGAGRDHRQRRPAAHPAGARLFRGLAWNGWSTPTR